MLACKRIQNPSEDIRLLIPPSKFRSMNALIGEPAGRPDFILPDDFLRMLRVPQYSRSRKSH